MDNIKISMSAVDVKKHTQVAPKIISGCIALGVLYWITDSLIDVHVYHEGDLLSQIFTPSSYEISTRLLTICLFISTAFAGFSMARRKSSDRALKESEERYKGVIENIGIGISVVSPGMEILSLNAQMKKWFPDIDVSKKPVCYEAFNNPPRKDLCSYCPTCKTLDDGQTHEAITYTPVGDEIRNYRVISSPIRNAEGAVTAAVEMVEDITERRKAEERIKDASLQWQITFDSIRDGIFIADANGIILRCNKAFADFVNSAENEIVGRACHEVVHGIADFMDGCPFIAAKNTLHREVLELKAGNKWLYVTVDPILNNSGEVISFVHAISDITKRKQAEERIKEGSALLEAINRTQSQFIVDTDPAVIFNSILDSLLSLTQSVYGFIGEILFTVDGLPYLKTHAITNISWNEETRAFYEQHSPNMEFHNLKTLFGEVMKTGRPVISNEPSSDPRKGGLPQGHPSLECFLGIPFYSGNNMVGMVGIANRPGGYDEKTIEYLQPLLVTCSNIIEAYRNNQRRKRAEEELFQITRDWEETFNTITDMITIHDKDFNIIHANKAAAKLLGLPLLDVSPTKCYQYYHGTGCPPEGCPSCECLKTGLPSANEIFEPHLKMFIEIRAIPRFDSNNNLSGLIHVVRDITERKKLEDQLRQSQKMEAIGQLAGGIAHDFNNILTAVIGYATILKMRMGKDEPLTINLDHILAASEKGANLTQSLLAFSRQQISNPEPVNINAIISSMEKLLIRVIGENIELKIIQNPPLSLDKGGVEGLIVMADHIQIDQVLINICTNARDAMPDGGVLTIETGRMELDREFITTYGYGKPGAYAVISVSDTGIGMDDKIRDRIFEPFYTTKEVGRGSGLGLSMVYGIIKQHNGFITCDSKPGKGSTFKIYLPIIKSAIAEFVPEEITELTRETATILLAEDEPSVRKLTRQVLEDSGYKVIEAADGEEAVNKFIENMDGIDFLVFDVILPKMNGKEAYVRIKKMKPGIRALMMSGYPADFIQKQEIIRQGIHFVAKPVSPAGLLKSVKEAIGR